jgi:hypothetical protein
VELTRPLSVAAPAQMDVHGIAGRSDKDTDMVGCLVPTDSISLATLLEVQRLGEVDRHAARCPTTCAASRPAQGGGPLGDKSVDETTGPIEGTTASIPRRK